MAPIKVGHIYYPPTPLSANQPIESKASTVSTKKNSIFAKQLHQSLQQNAPLKFSHHARLRLAERGIDLSADQLQRLEQGMHKAQQKGAQESLFILEDIAFVVSVKNQTVITALDRGQMSEQVITNIDSALLL